MEPKSEEARIGLFGAEHNAFRQDVRQFIAAEIAPHLDRWKTERIVDRAAYRAAGEANLLGLGLSADYGGREDADFRYNVVLDEELAWAGAASLIMNFGALNDLLMPYLRDLCTPGQAERWLPGLCNGELVPALAMTERTAGSDLRSIATSARLERNEYVLRGSKIFVGNGINADLVFVVARTSEESGGRFTLLAVERGMPGFDRRTKLRKIGLHPQDTAELHFDDVRVPMANRLGGHDEAMAILRSYLPRERLTAAVTSAAMLERVVDQTVDHVRTRRAFGGVIADKQAVRFQVADLVAGARLARSYTDDCTRRYTEGSLSATEAALVKLTVTELHQRGAERSQQLYGGHGYLEDNPGAQALLDSRQATIYGGTSEIMREIVGRDYVRPDASRLAGRPFADRDALSSESRP